MTATRRAVGRHGARGRTFGTGVGMGLSENWATLWEALADAQPDHIAVVVGERHMRWRDLDDRAARLAGALAEHGIGANAKVAQLLFNCPEYLESVYAALKLRAAPVNVNHRYLADEIAYVLNDAEAEVLFFHASLADRVAGARAQAPTTRLLVQVDDAPGTPAPLLDGAVRYEDLLAGEPAARIVRSGEDELLLYTGGTTGMPKGVVWRHVDLWGALAFTGFLSLGIEVPETADELGRVAAELNESGRSPVNMCAPPLMHGTALFLAMATFVLGGTVVLLGGRRYDATEVLALIERERVTQLSLVGDPFARPLVAALEAAEAAGRPADLSSLQRVVTTGATMSAESKRGIMDRRALTIIDMIGASEGGPFALAVTPPGADPGDTAVFKATAATVVLDDETWLPIPPGAGRPGVLAVSGPMPRRYHRDPVKSAATFRVVDGTAYTTPGDYAVIDADATVHLLGRGSVCINSGGEKIYAEEVENAARTHPNVVDCTAVGVPDARFGEAVTLVVALATTSPDAVDALVDHIRGRIAPYKAPRHVIVVDQFVRSPSGKADYRWAKATALARLGIA